MFVKNSPAALAGEFFLHGMLSASEWAGRRWDMAVKGWPLCAILIQTPL